jgi:hypothetical protein
MSHTHGGGLTGVLASACAGGAGGAKPSGQE